MKKIIVLIAILTEMIIFLNVQGAVVHAVDPIITSQCNSIQISPAKPAYLPGEQVTITVTGQGELSTITSRYAPAKRNIIQTPFISTEILGTYNASSKTWTSNWTVPGDGEYIIMPNMVQTNGQQCAGNPAYSSTTRQGTMAGGGLTAGSTPCNGCHKTIAVDRSYGAKAGDSDVYDMKEYWNLTPGNYWMYTGTNVVCGINYPTDTSTDCSANPKRFITRVTAEEKVKLAGLDVFPLRFTKDGPEGYIYANRNSTMRIFLSYFQGGAPWSSTTLGRPFALEYRLPDSRDLATLGTLIASVRHYSNEQGVDFDNIYFAPQFLGKEFMPTGWEYEAIDRIYFYDDFQKIYSGNLDYQANIRERWASDQLFYETDINTPIYKGPGLRLRLFEAGYPIGSGWRIREDWYFAKGIGRVKINTIDCRKRLSTDQDCNINSIDEIAKPDLTMSLTSYYSGGPLSTSVTVDSSGTKWWLHASTSDELLYTGYLEAKNCISETSCTPGTPFKWGYGDGTYFWMQDGVMEVDTSKVVDFQPGLRHVWFRPWVEKPPAGATAEQILTNTQLPWSNENIFRLGDTPLPGDLTETGDIDGDHVNIYDYQVLANSFGNPYTIFDYNNLVANYGK